MMHTSNDSIACQSVYMFQYRASLSKNMPAGRCQCSIHIAIGTLALQYIPGCIQHILTMLQQVSDARWHADDSALVRLRGTTATTNFPLLDYRSDLAAYHKLQQVGTAGSM